MLSSFVCFMKTAGENADAWIIPSKLELRIKNSNEIYLYIASIFNIHTEQIQFYNVFIALYNMIYSICIRQNKEYRVEAQ